MALIYWGQVNAAGDITMSSIIETSGTQTRAAVIALISPIAAGIISSDPTIKEAAAAAAVVAVAEEIADVGLVVAIPKNSVATSTRTALPMSWMEHSVYDPWTDTYADTETSTWADVGTRGKNVPLLTNAGVLALDQMPSAVALKSDIPEMPVFPTIHVERVIRPELPIFGARVAAGFLDGAAVATVFAGSSTTASQPGYIARLSTVIQGAYPVTAPSPPQWSSSAEFIAHAAAGIHCYSAGQSSTTAANYLTDAESDRIAALDPALILHMIGSSNDYTNQSNPATVQANIEARLAYFDTVLTKPCQHVLVHTYARMEYAPATYPHSAYGDAIKAAADARDDTHFIDISGAYRTNGVPIGGDPLNLIGTDNIHQTAQGYRFMADLLTSHLVA